MRVVRREFWIALALLAAFPAMLYLPGFGHDFVYDDHGQLEENVFLQNPANVADVLLMRTLDNARVINGRRPLVLLTYFADRALWGPHAAGYRFTNLAAHVVTGWLFFLLLLRLSGRKEFSFLAAVLFSLHPVLIEAVHVPAFRPDVFCGLFSLAFLLVAVRAEMKPAGQTTVAGALLWLALCSKEAAAVVPVLLAGLWICLPKTRLPVRRMALLFAGSLGLVLLFMKLSAGSGFQAVGGPWNGRSFQPPHNNLTAPWLFLRMLGLLAIPWPLVADRVVLPVTTFADPRFAAGLAALILCISAAFFFLRRSPWISLSLGWMLAAFLPVSSLVPLFNPLAERYLYFMAAGFCILPAHLLAGNGLFNHAGGRSSATPHETGLAELDPPIRFKIRPVIIIAACTLYLVVGWVRMPVWKNDVSLWTQTLSDEPNSTRARVWLALDLKEQGRREEAMAHLDAAIRINPQDVSAYINRGILWGEMGYYDRAEDDLTEAVARRPDSSAAHWNMAVMLQYRGDIEGMRREIEKTLELNPEHEKALQVKKSLESAVPQNR